MQKNSQNIIVKVFPHNFPIGKNQNMSIWLVSKYVMLFSKFAKNFLIISPKAESPLEGFNIHYIAPLKKSDLKETSFGDWNISNAIERKDYTEQVVSYIKTVKPKLIEVENDIRLAGNIAKVCTNIPVVFIPHVVVAKRKFISRLMQYWRYIKPITKIIFVSYNHQKHFYKSFFYSKKPSTVIHNSYAHVKAKNVNFSEKLNQIIFAGRAVTFKGYQDFILGVLPVLQKKQDWQGVAVLSIETENMNNEVEAFLKKPEITEAIKNGSLKVIKNLPNNLLFKAFAKAKIAVFPTHPSWLEGLPLVAIEAHLAKCALITSANPGFKELSSNNILYLDEINPSDITAKINYLIDNPKALENLALSGYKHITNNYNIEKLVKKYDQIREEYLQ